MNKNNSKSKTLKTKKKQLSYNSDFEVNIKGKATEIDVLLGHGDHILRGYNRNNIKLKGGWYYRNITINTEFILNVVDHYGIEKINFIGSSKSCSGAVIFTKALLKEKSDIQCNLFMFSAYTTVDKDVHIKREIDQLAPGTLKSFWESERYTQPAIKRMEAKSLEDKKNVNLYLFYPVNAKSGEDLLAKRVQGKNVFHIAVPVGMHNTLFPLWKKIDREKKIEIYENQFRTLTKNDYEFYSKMQSYKKYDFNLYSCVSEPKVFLEAFNTFKESFRKQQDKKRGIIISPNAILNRDTVSLEAPVSIYRGVNIRPSAKIGGFSFINGGTTVFQKVEIGRYCSIGKNCEIGAGDHPLTWLSTSPFQYSIETHFSSHKGTCNQVPFDKAGPPTKIGNDVWMGSLVLVKRGVSIGDGAVVAGGAVVTEDVPPYAIVGGVPAKILKYRFDPETIQQLQALKWWELNAKQLRDIQFDDIQTAIRQLKEKRPNHV